MRLSNKEDLQEKYDFVFGQDQLLDTKEGDEQALSNTEETV